MLRNFAVFLLLCSGAALHGQDPFLPFLDRAAIPKDTLSTENSGTGAAAITVRKFTFSSRNGINTVYAVLAQPQQAGSYPAVLFLHGGGSRADDMAGFALDNARRGMVGMAIDLPGICGTGNTPNSAGPWKSRPPGEAPRFDMSNGGNNSTLLDAEVAGLEAFNWLRAQPNVKADAMGINGQSWGGYSTTILSGLLGSKVKAAYSVYGSGYYDAGSFWKGILAGLSPADRTAWLNTFDAGRRAPGIKAAYFLEGASNDNFFWPEAVAATLKAIPGPKNHAFGPNLDHDRMPAANAMQRIWFDHHLKGTEKAFPAAKVIKSEAEAGGGIRVTVQVDLPAGLAVDSVRVFHSARDSNWTKRAWTGAKAQAVSGGANTYAAVIPAAPAGKTWDYFAQAWDNRSVAVAGGLLNSGTPVAVLPALRTPSRPSARTSMPVRADGRRFTRIVPAAHPEGRLHE